MQQRHPVRAEVRGEGIVGGLRVLHGVADDDGAPALGERLVEHGHEVLRGLRDQREYRSARLGAPASDDVDIDPLPAPGNRREHGVPDIAVEAGAVVDLAAAPAPPVRLGEFDPALRRKGRREEDHGDPVHAQPGERGLQVGAHVGVGRVDLVEDHGFPHQPQVADQDVARLERGQQDLVDRADHDWRQGGAPPTGHPRAGAERGVVLPGIRLFLVVDLHRVPAVAVQ